MTTTADTPSSVSQDVVARIQELTPLIQRHAADSEKARRVADETVEALRDAGVFRIAVPQRYGGSETNLRTMLDVSAAIAESDGGSAWMATLSNVVAWSVGLFNQETTDEVWAKGPDTIFCGVVAPGGSARKVPGGYRLTARWPYASASLHADWTASGVFVVDDDDQVVDQGMVAIPRCDFTVEDTWHVAGMRASGSNTIVVQDVFIPEHRYTSALPWLTGSYVAEHPGSSLHRCALGPMLVMVVIGPQLGMARAVLDSVIGKGADKALAYTSFEHNRDSVAFQLLVAEAALKIDTAHLHTYRAADDVQRYAQAGVFPSVVQRARIRGDAAVALRNVNEALNILLDANGAGSFAEISAVQRMWRDSNVGARHAVILPHVSLETYGKALLGIEEHITPII